ncbi:MAG: protein TolQ [Thermodesulfobacteriota bacterium]|jgi:biopolymer transport protein TolQ
MLSIVNQNEILSMVWNAGPMVKLVLFLLLSFSILSWSIIFMKYRIIHRARKETNLFQEIFWKSKSLAVAYTESKDLQYSPVAEVFRVGYQELGRLYKMQQETEEIAQRETTDIMSTNLVRFENIPRALRAAMNSQVTRLGYALTFLATTGNTAPFIGLFGTVWGIMNSFQSIGLRGGASLAVVAPGISEALIATAAGLAAAIPSVIGYNYFSNQVRVLESEMNNFCSDFLNIIERDQFKKAGLKK